MHKQLFLILLLPMLFVDAQTKNNSKAEVEFVNPYIGTALKNDGGLALSVGPPFTMTNFSPQTCENKISRMYYVYEDTSIPGFIASHQPTVWMGDYGYVSVMPEMPNLNSRENRLKEMKAYIKVDPKRLEITGYNPDRHCLNLGPELKNFNGYFVIQFDKHISEFGTWNNDSVFALQEELVAGKRVGLMCLFPPKKTNM